jgi:hypothetical protein
MTVFYGNRRELEASWIPSRIGSPGRMEARQGVDERVVEPLVRALI